MLMMEHRTPQGLEIRMFGREAKRIFGVRVDRNERDETEDELKARFAEVLKTTNFAAIAEVFSVTREKPAQKPTQKSETVSRGRRKSSSMMIVDRNAGDPIPQFLSEPKK
jgi:hypothetical protein